jgi:hypothetical protein
MTYGKATKTNKKAPKVPNPNVGGNYMKESDTKSKLKSKNWPLKSKRTSK